MENNLNLSELIVKLKEGSKVEELGIEVLRRLPMAEKMFVIEGYKDEKSAYSGLAEECTSTHGSIKKVDYCIKEIMTVTTIMNSYTNIDMTIDFAYDKIMDSGIYKYVLSQIDTDDYKLFHELLEDNIKQKIELFNGIIAFLDRKLTELFNKIPDKKAMNKIIKEIKNIDEGKINQLKGIVNKFNK